MFEKIIQKFKKQPLGEANINDALSHYEKGLKWIRIKRYEEALREFKQSAAINPKQALTFFQLGNTYFKLKQFSEAKKAYHKFLDLDADIELDSHLDIHSDLDLDSVRADAYNDLSVIYDADGDFIKTIGFCRTSIRLKRDNPDALNNLGEAYYKMGIYPESIKAFEQVLSLKPDDARAHYGLGLVYIDLRDRNLATKEFQILENLDTTMAHDLRSKLRKI